MTAWTRLFHKLWEEILEAREIVNTTAQERISERRVGLPECRVIEVPKISRQESVEVVETLPRQNYPAGANF